MTARAAARVGVVALVLAVAACGGGRDPATHSGRVAPLTGLPDPDGAAQRRPALAVKIENTPEARPQSGLDRADVVYEQVLEGGVTRFWAVFSSAAPDRVGPVRSVRAMDADILASLGGVAAYSGGTAANVARVRQAPVVPVDEANGGRAFRRERTRDAPHNLYVRPELLWRRAGPSVPPAAQFEFLDEGARPAGGERAAVVTLGYAPGYETAYTYDVASGRWERSYGEVPHVSESGGRIAPTNVIVQFVRYTAGGDGRLIGEGDAWVLGAGRVVEGRWVKASPRTPTRFVDSRGAPIRLRPGRTWVELLPVGAPVTVRR